MSTGSRSHQSSISKSHQQKSHQQKHKHTKRQQRKSMKSPQNQTYNHRNKTKVSISELTQFTEYQLRNKLKFAQQTINKISKALELKEISENSCNQRTSRNDLFFKYNKQEITKKIISSYSEDRQIQKSTQRSQQSSKILKAINTLRQKNNINQINNRMPKRTSLFNQLYDKLLKKRKLEEFQIKKQKNTSKNQYIMDYKNKNTREQNRKNIKQIFFEPQLSLKDIVSIQEEKRVHPKMGNDNFNIFKIKFESNRQTYLSNQNQLQQNYFCSDSIVNKSQIKVGVNPEQQLSNISRMFASSLHLKISKGYKLKQEDAYFDIRKIQFFQIMLVARGVLQPKICFSYLFGQKKQKNKDSYQIHNAKSIYYRQNHEKKQATINQVANNRDEIESYQQMQLNQEQLQSKQLAQKHMKRIQQVLGLQGRLKKTMIEDLSSNQIITNNKNNILYQQLDLIKKFHPKAYVDNDKYIRHNKIHKDRRQKLKIETILQTIYLKKKKENIMATHSKDKAR